MKRRRLPNHDGLKVVLDLYRPIYAIPSWYLYSDCIEELGRDLYTDRQIRQWIGDQLNWGVYRAQADTAVLLVEDQLAGFIGLYPDGFIDMIAVAPELARRGLGTVLLAWAIRESMLAYLDELVVLASPLARPLFQKHGFKVERVNHRVQNGVRMNSYSMCLQLRGVNIEKYEFLPSLVPHFDLRVNALPKQRPVFLSRRWKGYGR